MEPFFSICIPQYGRTNFLLQALRSFAAQTERAIEICVSDGASPDGRQDEVEDALRATGLPYRFARSAQTLRYDANLRSAIGLARGTWCVLMGNDDALKHDRVLETVRARIAECGPCGVVIPDFEDWHSGARANRIRATRNYGAGVDVAATHFRNLSFVSGIALLREPAQALATARWDGAEMYQTYLACRMIASGHGLLEIAEPLVRKDIQVPGERADSYATRPRVDPCPIVERPIPLGRMGQLVADAIAPALDDGGRRRANAAVLRQLIQYTYPFWLVEYRRVQSWRFAAGVALGLRFARIAQGVELSPWHALVLRLRQAAAFVVALAVPLGAFDALRPWLYRLAKRT